MNHQIKLYLYENMLQKRHTSGYNPFKARSDHTRNEVKNEVKREKGSKPEEPKKREKYKSCYNCGERGHK